MTHQFSVPGNLLLAGEYAILEEGGLGLAVAGGARLQAQVQEASVWSLEGRWPGGGETWQAGREPQTLASRMLSWLLSQGEFQTAQPAQVVLDSQDFFDGAGRKRGFGSSAAAAVALTAAVAFRTPGLETTWTSRVPGTAVQAHRWAQGGKGSGYDVLCSFHGGYSFFMGGAQPQAQPWHQTILPDLWVTPGPEAVKTQSAVGSYRQWKAAHPEETQKFLAANNRLLQNLKTARTWPEARTALEALKTLGLQLGRDIGVSAELPLPDLPPESFSKASGAGNEMALILGPPPPGAWAWHPSPGLTWEPRS